MDLLSAEIEAITTREFGVGPHSVVRMANGTCNEVYAITVNETEYIVRLSIESKWLRGSSKYIPIFKSLEIPVPNIISENYSKEITPYNYQILSRLPGADITNVIASLNDDELKAIAGEIATIVKKLRRLPTTGMYGCVGDADQHLKSTWNEFLLDMLETVKTHTGKTGVVVARYIRSFEQALKKYANYVARVPSEFYFDDMCSKNVLVNEGKFVGLVDLDGVAYGDYLEGIGRIKASWYGTPYGTTYTRAIEDTLRLGDYEREIVTFYALLNRIFWLSEVGIQFNQNTSPAIDPNRVRGASEDIEGLITELELTVEENAFS